MHRLHAGHEACFSSGLKKLTFQANLTVPSNLISLYHEFVRHCRGLTAQFEQRLESCRLQTNMRINPRAETPATPKFARYRDDARFYDCCRVDYAERCSERMGWWTIAHDSVKSFRQRMARQRRQRCLRDPISARADKLPVIFPEAIHRRGLRTIFRRRDADRTRRLITIPPF